MKSILICSDLSIFGFVSFLTLIIIYLIKWYNSKSIKLFNILKNNHKKYYSVSQLKSISKLETQWHNIQASAILFWAVLVSFVSLYVFGYSAFILFIFILSVNWIGDLFLNLLMGWYIFTRGKDNFFDNIGGRFNWIIRFTVLIVSVLLMILFTK